MDPKTKRVVTIFSVLIVLSALLAVAPVLYAAFNGPGVKVEPFNASGTPATTDVNGRWEVVTGKGKNTSAAGFTFDEVLPGKAITTSGTSYGIGGYVLVEDNVAQSGEVTVDAAAVKTDEPKRDNNVRRQILETEKFPTARFTLTQPVDLSHVPDDGSTVPVTVSGDLTLHGVTQPLTAEFAVAREADHVLMHADVPIRRADFGMGAIEFLAAKIADVGELNIRLYLEKA